MRAARFLNLCTLIIASCSLATGQVKHTMLYTFGAKGMNDGSVPNGDLVFDGAGNIYGTTAIGGDNFSPLCPAGCGTVFELSPISGGGWTETVLHSFADDQDGLLPVSGLIFDPQGNLYGTTQGSGNVNCLPPDCGTVFELSPSGNGAWTETVLYSFTGTPDGLNPLAAVILDSSGNLYGTTLGGGSVGFGTVFELAPPSLPGGNWTETILYNFCQTGGQRCSDGASPYAGVTFDGLGNLYGTTTNGAVQGVWGLVYQLAPNLDGTWKESVVYKFGQNVGKNGGMPRGGVSFDPSGDLFGTLFYGGLSEPQCDTRCGGAFRLAPKTDGGWTENAYLFNGKDGGNPTAGLIIDGSVVYGSTRMGGYGYGTVFKFSGKQETVIYKLCSQTNCMDGKYVSGQITLHDGQLYGAAQNGGTYNQGVIFSLAP